MLGLSEHMFWIQSMPIVPYVYLEMPIGWIGLDMTIIMYVHMPFLRDYFKTRGVKKISSMQLRLYLPMFLLRVGLFTFM